MLADMAKSALTDSQDGISVDAQAGSNENKIKTGVGSIGGKKSEQSIKSDEGNVEVRNTDGKFHIESEESVNITVEETNVMVYWLMGSFFLLTLIREFFSWRKRGVK